jgi:Arc/MetJ family transcription regulator
MKTTIDISDPLLRQAKRVAARERTTVRALVEQGLRRELAERGRGAPFHLRQVTVRGNGLQAGLDYDWDSLSALVYEGRGG